MTSLPNGAGTEQLVFGTNRGLALYTPARRPPGVRLVQVLGQRAYTPDEWNGLVLAYPQNTLLIQAAAMGGRTYPEHFQYLFSLLTPEGRELRRSLSPNGQFSAEGLQAGGYRIEARALGIDLAPSTPAALSFEVGRAPIPWPSIALGGLLGASLLALAWGYVQNRRLQRVNRELSDTRLQLVQETESERRRIARDLHDQTLADLRRLLLAAPAAGAGGRSATFTHEVEAISNEIRRICEDLSPSVLENVGLTAALEWALGEAVREGLPRQACKARFACSDDVEDRLGLDSAVRIQVYRIVREALSNAVRHARPSELFVSVALLDGGGLAVSVEDDGPGFDIARVTMGRGLANIRSRANLIGAEVTWERGRSGGTLFRLELRGAARDETASG